MGTDDYLRADDLRPAQLLAAAGKTVSTTPKVILISGGFDPLHIGHVNLITAAAEYGLVYIALNSDAWLVRKKSFCFMPWEERGAILRALRFVSRVVSVNDDNGSVGSAILHIQPDYFANGGDRTEPNLYEAAACKRVGCRELFGIGGAKVQSSSALVRRRME